LDWRLCVAEKKGSVTYSSAEVGFPKKYADSHKLLIVLYNLKLAQQLN
jgi:hypothetical protein